MGRSFFLTLVLFSLAGCHKLTNNSRSDSENPPTGSKRAKFRTANSEQQTQAQFALSAQDIMAQLASNSKYAPNSDAIATLIDAAKKTRDPALWKAAEEQSLKYLKNLVGSGKNMFKSIADLSWQLTEYNCRFGSTELTLSEEFAGLLNRIRGNVPLDQMTAEALEEALEHEADKLAKLAKMLDMAGNPIDYQRIAKKTVEYAARNAAKRAIFEATEEAVARKAAVAAMVRNGAIGIGREMVIGAAKLLCLPITIVSTVLVDLANSAEDGDAELAIVNTNTHFIKKDKEKKEFLNCNYDTTVPAKVMKTRPVWETLYLRADWLWRNGQGPNPMLKPGETIPSVSETFDLNIRELKNSTALTADSYTIYCRFTCTYYYALKDVPAVPETCSNLVTNNGGCHNLLGDDDVEKKYPIRYSRKLPVGSSADTLSSWEKIDAFCRATAPPDCPATPPEYPSVASYQHPILCTDSPKDVLEQPEGCMENNDPLLPRTLANCPENQP